MITVDSSLMTPATPSSHLQGDEGLFDAVDIDPLPARIPPLYRMRELDAFAPSRRAAVLRRALRGADRQPAVLRQGAIGMAFALGIAVPLGHFVMPAPLAMLCAGGAFTLAFLAARRRDVRRLLKERLVQDNAADLLLRHRSTP